MTKHELLSAFRDYGQLTVTEIFKADNVSRVAIWKTLEKLRREGCLKIADRRGREKLYEMTGRGFEKLTYFDNDGCIHPLCSCMKK